MPQFDQLKEILVSSFPGLSESVFQPDLEDGYRAYQLLQAATSVPFFIHKSILLDELRISFLHSKQDFKQFKIEMDQDNNFKIYGQGDDRSFSKLESEDICDWIKIIFPSLSSKTVDIFPAIRIAIEEEASQQPPILSKEATIVDFDQTLTIYHTFDSKNIHKFGRLGNAEIYNSGKIDAQTNLKQGVQNIFKLSSDALCAVATYHNNPFYVAGYISVILGKELNFDKKIGGSKQEVKSPAIALFSVEGESKPVLISYLDADEDGFDKLMKSLISKNRQIMELRTEWLKLNLINEQSEINFYDDSLANYEGAKTLGYVNSYYVDRTSDEWTVLTSSLIKDRLSMLSTDNAEPQVDASSLHPPTFQFNLVRLNEVKARRSATRMQGRELPASGLGSLPVLTMPNTPRARAAAMRVPGTPMLTEQKAMLQKFKARNDASALDKEADQAKIELTRQLHAVEQENSQLQNDKLSLQGQLDILFGETEDEKDYLKFLLELKKLNNTLCSELIKYIESSRANNSISIHELTHALKATKKLVSQEMTPGDYVALAHMMQGSSSYSLKGLGVAMIGFALGLVVFGLMIAPFLLSSLPAASLMMSGGAIGSVSTVSATTGYGFFVEGSQHGLSLKMTELNERVKDTAEMSPE